MSLSASVAVTTAPTLVPTALFSSTSRVAVASANTGAVLARSRSVTDVAEDQSRPAVGQSYEKLAPGSPESLSANEPLLPSTYSTSFARSVAVSALVTLKINEPGAAATPTPIESIV